MSTPCSSGCSGRRRKAALLASAVIFVERLAAQVFAGNTVMVAIALEVAALAEVEIGLLAGPDLRAFRFRIAGLRLSNCWCEGDEQSQHDGQQVGRGFHGRRR